VFAAGRNNITGVVPSFCLLLKHLALSSRQSVAEFAVSQSVAAKLWHLQCGVREFTVT